MDEQWHSDKFHSGSNTYANAKYLERSHNELMEKMSSSNNNTPTSSTSGRSTISGSSGAGTLVLVGIVGLAVLWVWIVGISPYVWMRDYIQQSSNTNYSFISLFGFTQILIVWLIYKFVERIGFRSDSVFKKIVKFGILFPLLFLLILPFMNFVTWLFGFVLAENFDAINAMRSNILDFSMFIEISHSLPTKYWNEGNEIYRDIYPKMHFRLAEGAIGFIILTAVTLTISGIRYIWRR